jgi:predicted transcriptional regulator of viral defense system
MGVASSQVFTTHQAPSSLRGSALRYARNRGKVIQVKRGLYLTTSSLPADPFALLQRGFPSPVISHRSALELHGHAPSHHSIHTAFTLSDQRPFKFKEYTFVAVAVPKALRDKNLTDTETVRVTHKGRQFTTTSLERTFVDCLARPDLSGGLEAVWRGFGSVAASLDITRLCHYVVLLENKTLVALVGLLLNQFSVHVSTKALELLRRHAPMSPHYAGVARGEGTLVKDWNVVVPRRLANQPWEEMYIKARNPLKEASLPKAVPARLRACAKPLAQRYIWWEPAEKTIQNFPRFLSHAMNLATWEDQTWLETHFPASFLRAALSIAPAGTFTPRSWNYWHVRLGMRPSPLPQKQIPP